jgi:hypothetical protein
MKVGVCLESVLDRTFVERWDPDAFLIDANKHVHKPIRVTNHVGSCGIGNLRVDIEIAS